MARSAEPSRAQRDRRRIALDELALVPIRIDGRTVAGFVELRDLLGRQLPADGEQVLAELLFVAGADDDVVYGRALKEPVQGYDWDWLFDFFCHGLERIDDLVQVFVFDLRAEVGSFVQAAFFG